MNTFDGNIIEFPGLAVDRFNTGASVFLLTHCHMDHVIGLLNKSFGGLIYCSKETKLLLAIKPEFKNVLSLVKTVPYNEPTRIEHSLSITITLIPAYHCLGASMFLVEGDKKAVICTGDIRAERWWTQTLLNLPSLFPYLNRLKELDNIYLDSTFSGRREPYIEIPPNNAGVYTAICLLKNYPKDDPEITFSFQDVVLGFEQSWAFIMSYFGSALHVSNPTLRKLLQLVVDHDLVNGPLLKRALVKYPKSNKGIFHACRNECTEASNAYVVKIKQCVYFNIMDFAGVFCPLSLDTLEKDELAQLKLVRTTKKGNKIFELRGREWILPKDTKELLPSEVKLVFSRHASYSEIKDFVALFRPKQVYPFVDYNASWMNGFVMARLFGSVCSGSDFYYDTIQRKKYGQYPPKDIMDREVVTIDRWDAEECRKEELFVHEVLAASVQEEHPALINIRKVIRVPAFKKFRTKDEQEFVDKRNKNMSLQKIVEGRHEVSYKKFIEIQQKLYYKRHNHPLYERDFESEKYNRVFDSTLGGSSDYDTDSCSSSLDLLTMCTRSPTRAEKESSEISETQRSNEAPRSRKMQRSFVRSSFDSFEESIYPTKRKQPGSVCQRIYYHPEAAPNELQIERISHDIAANPRIWFARELQSTK